MRTTLMPVAALLLSVAILLMGNGLQGVLLPIRAGIEAFSTFEIGVLGSSYYLGFVFGCILGPRVVRRVGHVRAFAAMVSVASSIALVHALISDPVLWWLLRCVTGFCFAILFMIIESWLNERSTNQTRGRVFSVYTIINLTVITLGQLMVTLHNPAAFPLFALASILVSMAVVPVALSIAPSPAPISEVRFRLWRLFGISPVGFVGSIAVGATNGAFWSLGPAFAQGSGLNVTGIAFFMSITVIGGALGQWPLGFASDQTDRRKVIIATCIAGALAGAGMVLFDDVWGRGIFVFAFLFGMFTLPVYSLSAAHMNDSVASDEYVETSGGLLLLFGIGAGIGPLIASTLMTVFGVDGLFVFTALIHLMFALFAFQRLHSRARPGEDDRVPFTDSLLSAQTVMPIDPAGEAES
jgi:MFS family permease